MATALDGIGRQAYPRLRTVVGVYVVFTIVGLLEATQAWIGMRTGHFVFTGNTYRGQPIGWIDIVARQTLSWWVFAAFALATLAVGLRFPIGRQRWRRTALLHVAGSLLFPLLTFSVSSGLRYGVFLRHEVDVTFLELLARSMTIYYSLYLLYYWAIIGAASAFVYYGLYREQALAQARLERDLSEAHLKVLQSQLQPHFLFNTLNAVCGYALERNHEAVIAMLTRLSDLLRAVLGRRSAPTIPLEEELRTLNAYVELQRLRLGDRLAVKIDIDRATLDAAVPPLVLQPIVENAIQHGASRRSHGGVVEVSATRRNGSVDIVISDNGPGFLDGSAPLNGRGLGLTSTVERLRLIYGSAHTMETAERDGGGAVVRLTIPYMASAESATLEER